ncbi:MAG: class I SAM-dependent methyltransferase [Sphingomonadaceae bacterium]
MGLWERHVVSRVIACGCCLPPVMERRAKVVPLAQGSVLEVGCGAGANFRFYDDGRVSSVDAIDPSPELLQRARDAAPDNAIDFRLGPGVGEALPFADESFDSVVLTFTLCSVGNPSDVLREARRVLKPTGKLLFLEHGLSPDRGLQRWQRRVDHVWPALMGNCHLSRAITPPIRANGFEIIRSDSGYVDKTPRFLGWMEWGEAIVA